MHNVPFTWMAQTMLLRLTAQAAVYPEAREAAQDALVYLGFADRGDAAADRLARYKLHDALVYVMEVTGPEGPAWMPPRAQRDLREWMGENDG